MLADYVNSIRGSDSNDEGDVEEFFSSNLEEVNSTRSDRMFIAESESVFRRISKQGFRMGKSIRDERYIKLAYEGLSELKALFLCQKEITDWF